MKSVMCFLILGLLAFGCAVRGDEAINIPLIAPISEAAIRAPLVVEKIKSGEMTAEEAWQKGELNEDVLLFLLNQPSGYLGDQNLLDRAGLVGPFVKLLIEKLPEKVRDEKQLANLGTGVRYRLADNWFKQNEPRGALLLEELVKEGAQEFEKTKALPWYYELSVTRLGEWYRDTRQHEKALQLLEEGRGLSKNPSYLADWLVLAARVYRRMGKIEKAKELYDQVPPYKVAWFTGLAYVDQAADLFARGEWEKGRALLEQPIEGADSEAAQLIAQSRLGYSYYQTGDWEKARFHSQKALDLFKVMKPQPGIDNDIAQQTLQEMERWSKETIVCEPKQLHVLLPVASEKNEAPITTRRLAVLTQELLPLTVESDSPQIKARFIDADKPARRAYAYERELLVEISPLANQKSWQASLFIQAPGEEKFQTRLPLNIQQQLPIRLSQPRLFFGFVQAGQKARQTLKLSAPEPFALIKAEPDNAALRVAKKAVEVGAVLNEHALTFEITAGQAGEIHEGRVRLTTNLPQQEVIEVPYFACAQ